MFKLIKEIFNILTPEEKKEFFILQILVTFIAIMEVVGIASIGPFIALVSDPNLIQTNTVYKTIYEFTGIASPNKFLTLMGFSSLILLGLGTFISVLTTWRLSLYSFKVGTNIGDSLYEYYLNREWLFHANSSSAELTKKISTESNRVTYGILLQMMNANARMILSLFISIGVIAFNPVIALSGIFLFSFGYFVIYKTIRKKLSTYGSDISHSSTVRFRLMNEGFGGIKDILLKRSQDHFTKRFKEVGDINANAYAKNTALSTSPRYIMEFIAFGAIISLILYLLKAHNGILSEVLPILSIYALASFKLLPALQQLYGNITTIKGHVEGFYAIKEDIENARSYKDSKNAMAIDLKNHKKLVLDKVSFSYPKAKKLALDEISLELTLNKTYGFVGESGAGKSTLVDLILGLIKPTSGSVRLDDLDITNHMESLKEFVSYVPQSIFLSEGTILENIAFGIETSKIDYNRAIESAKKAMIYDFIEGLDLKFETYVGERGVRLSGGQRQRIGIARALYHNSKILVFDEATSSLDGLTEKEIMEAITNLMGERTIILIAHRLKTVENCDTIFFFEHGKLIDFGSFQNLRESNLKFNEMTRFA